ncbi:hypothetical protein Tco_1413665 [Tanacetum coccineum]
MAYHQWWICHIVMRRHAFNPLGSNLQLGIRYAVSMNGDMAYALEYGCMLGIYFTKTHDKHIGDQNMMVDKAEKPPQSTPQVLPSFEVYTPPVTYPEEVEDILGTQIEVEPLDQTKLEDVGLTCNHNIYLISKKVPSFDEPEPQPNPLPNCPS